jgi:hypothetical protein
MSIGGGAREVMTATVWRHTQARLGYLPGPVPSLSQRRPRTEEFRHPLVRSSGDAAQPRRLLGRAITGASSGTVNKRSAEARQPDTREWGQDRLPSGLSGVRTWHEQDRAGAGMNAGPAPRSPTVSLIANLRYDDHGTRCSRVTCATFVCLRVRGLARLSRRGWRCSHLGWRRVLDRRQLPSRGQNRALSDSGPIEGSASGAAPPAPDKRSSGRTRSSQGWRAPAAIRSG